MPQLLNPQGGTRVPSEEKARVGPRASLDIMEKTNTIADIVHNEQPPLYINLRVTAISMHVSCLEVYHITRH